MQRGSYYRPYDKSHKYIPQGPNDIGKSSIPRNDRCNNFDDLWNATFMEVMKYWDFVPVDDIHEFDQYSHEDE